MARKIPEINAGSMADIAFLLLVFFLVTTKIETDYGLKTTLPPYIDEEIEAKKKNKRNVLRIIINGRDQLAVNETYDYDVVNLKDKAIAFITNNGRDPEMSDSPKAAVISLQNDNATSYERYLEVYNALQSAYNAIWEAESQRRFGEPYSMLDKERQLEIREKYPKILSEAEPSDFGN